MSESQPRNLNILPSKTDKGESSRALAQNGQCKNNQEIGKSPNNASKLLEQISLQSKQISVLTKDNITIKPGSVSVAHRNKSADDSNKTVIINVRSGQIFNGIHPSSSTKTVTCAPQQVGNAGMAKECRPQLRKLAFTCDDRSSLKAGVSSSDAKKSVVDVPVVPVSAINNSRKAETHSSFITTDTSKTVRVVVRDGQFPSLFKIGPVGNTSEISHTSRGVSGNSSSCGGIKTEPIHQPISDRRLAPVTTSSQNFYNLVSVNNSTLYPVYIQSRSKASSASYEVVGQSALESQVLSFTDIKSGANKPKSGIDSLKDNTLKQPTMSSSQSCSSLLSTPPSLTLPSGAILCQIPPKQQFSKAKIHPSPSEIRKAPDSSLTAPTTQQSSLPNMPHHVSLLPSTYVMRTNRAHTGSGTVLSPGASPYFSLPFPSGLKPVLASGAAQMVAENKPHTSLSNTTKCSSNVSQVSSQIVSKNPELFFNHASAVVVYAPPATSSFTENNQAVSADTTQLPPLCTLVSFQPNTMKASNSQIVESESKHSALLHTRIGGATKTSLVAKSSELSLARPLQPKLTSHVHPLYITSNLKPQISKVTTHNIECQQNTQCVQAKDNLQGPVKKLVISKESFINLNKDVQKVRKIPEGVSSVTTKCSASYSTTFISVLGQNSNPTTRSSEKQSVSFNNDFGTKSQTQSSFRTSKNTRLSTASIPRRSYLKMLRDDLPKEKGSISLISNGSVSVKKALKQKSTSCDLSRGTTVGPIFVTTTLRTSSGPVTVKVRSQDLHEYTGTSLDAEKQPLSDAKSSSHLPDVKISSLKKSEKGVSALKLPASSSRDLESNGPFVSLSPKDGRPEDSYSSDSDSDFLHDSEEQDLRVLGQLLQRDCKAISVALTSETCPSNSNISVGFNDMGSNSALSSMPTKRSKQLTLTDTTDKEYKTAHCYAKSSSLLKNPLADFEKKTLSKIHESSDIEGLKIESVFSLNHASTSHAEINANANQEEQNTCAEPLTRSDSKHSSLRHLKNNAAVPRWENALKPCFCVLERLSETDIERLTSEAKDSQRESGSHSQCSEHCRMRILTIMCSLNLLPCKSKQFFTLNEQENEKSGKISKPDQETDNVVNQKQLLKEKLKIAQQRLTEYLKSKSILKYEKTSLTHISPKEEGNVTAGTQMNSAELPVAEKAPAHEKKSVIYNLSIHENSVDKVLNNHEEEKRTRFQTLKKSSSQLSNFRQTMLKLRKQVESRRKQMYRQKYDTTKGLNCTYPNVNARSFNAILSRKSCLLRNRKGFGKRRKLRREAANLVSKEIPQLKCQGEIAKKSILSNLSKPIIAQLLPPGSISTQVTPSSEFNQTGVTNEEGSKHNIKLATKIRLPPVLPERNIQQDFASPNTTEWSVKIAEALKSLHSYLKTTGRQISGTETQHFLLRIGEQHVLVSVPPTEANGPTHNNKGTKSTLNTGAVASSSTSSSEAKPCKDSVELPPGKTAVKIKRKAEALSSSSNSQAARDCSESKIFRIGETSLVNADKNTTQSDSHRMVICKSKTQIEQTESRYQTVKKLLIGTEKASLNNSTNNKQLKSNASARQNQLLLWQSKTLEIPTLTSSSIQEKNSEPKRLSVVIRNEAESRTRTSLNSSNEEKRPRAYADPSSILSHLPLDSGLLPIPKRDVQKRLSKCERASRRAMLEKKYPLPPGVIIKEELDNDSFADAVDTCGASELCHSPAFGKDGTMRLNSLISSECEGCKEQAIGDRGCNLVLDLEGPSQYQKSFKSVLDLEQDSNECTGSETESEIKSKVEWTNSVGTGSDSLARYSPDGPPPLIAEAPTPSPTMTGSRKRLRKNRLVPRTGNSIHVNKDEHPPILQPMCSPTPIVQPTQFSSDEDVAISEKPSAFSFDVHESENLSKKQRLDSDSKLTPSASTSSNSPNSIGLAHTSNRGFRATEVSVSKNIRIQRLKEMLKKKELEIEAIRKTRSETTPI